ncbi:MAG: hypothetical protein P9M06_06370 [Candidatus Saelkia tenebricola]|nr:hypothetical protein [Candidatus Saelkia tenebricola]
MTAWSKETIEETLKVWQPYYDKEGIKLSEADAVEILDNMTGLAELLIELKNKESDKKIC